MSKALVKTSMLAQADTDEQTIRLWLRSQSSEHTREAYERDLKAFLSFVSRPLALVSVENVQDYADSLSKLAQASVARKMAAVKSLFTFSCRIGYLQFNVAHVYKLPKIKKTLSQKIITERDVIRLLDKEKSARNHALLRFLYVSGARVSEACGLRWRDLQEREQAEHGIVGQVTLNGKGGETRIVPLTSGVWDELLKLREEAASSYDRKSRPLGISLTDAKGVHPFYGRSPLTQHNANYGAIQDAPVFASKSGRPLRRDAVFRIVQAAGKRAGLKGLSPHWLRHAHCSHAMDNGAPAHLVQRDAGHESLATTSKYTHARPDDTSARFLPV